jgi:thioredoxin 1
MASLMIYALVGGGMGAALGYLGKCTSGTCPLTSTWWRGAIYGAALASLFYFMSGARGSGTLNESTGNIKRIGEKQFDAEVAQATMPVVVDFYATWCGPCQKLAPIMEEMAGQFTNRIKFVKVNVDESPALARQFDIEAIPTVIFFRSGKIADRLVGLPSNRELQARLNSLAATNTAVAGVR